MKIQLPKSVSNKFTKVSGKASRALFKVRKNAPAIMLVTGIVGTAGTVVYAFVQGARVKDTTDEALEKLDKIDADIEDESKPEYTEETAQEDRKEVYIHAWKQYTKCIAPVVGLGAASIGFIVSSHHILNARYLSVSAAYVALNQSYNGVLKRLKERDGEEAVADVLYSNPEKVVVQEEAEPDQNGNPMFHDTIEYRYIDGALYSPFAEFFCKDTTKAWKPDNSYNEMRIRAAQNQMNDQLRARGYLFLNDARKQLGFKPIAMGNVMGWIWDPYDPNKQDNVDFGIYNKKKPSSVRFLKGEEDAVLVDFNVTRNILADMERIESMMP